MVLVSKQLRPMPQTARQLGLAQVFPCPLKYKPGDSIYATRTVMNIWGFGVHMNSKAFFCHYAQVYLIKV
jgi:hypothetical protein